MGGNITLATDTSNASGLSPDFFQKIYARFELQGNYLTPGQKARIEQVTQEEYDKQNKAKLLGMNVGALPSNTLEILFSALKNLFSGEAQIPTTIEGWGNYIQQALSGATNSGKQYVVSTIAANTYERLLAEGEKDPTLASIADLVTGVSKVGNARDIGGRASIIDQLADRESIPKGTTSTLNRPPAGVDVADATAGSGLPLQRPLTQAQRGA